MTLIRSCFIVLTSLRNLAAADWDYSLRAIYVDNGTASLTTTDSGSNWKTICSIATALPRGHNVSSLGTWSSDGTVYWAVADALYAITPGNVTCTSTKFTLPFHTAGMSISGDNTLLLLSPMGGVYTWAAGTLKLSVQVNTTLVKPLSAYNPVERVLWLANASNPNQLLKVSLPTSGTPSVENISFGCDPLVGLYLGDSERALYAWGQDSSSNYLTLYEIETSYSGGMQCGGIVTTGGEGAFVAGDFDGQGSVAAMAADALYIVDDLNNRPDDMHIPVYGGFTPSKFVAIMYQGFGIESTSSSVLV